jgi:sugar lactone lactonase YvrE
MAALPRTEARVFVTNEDEDTFLPEGPRSVVVDGREAVMWVNIQTAPDATTGAVHARFWDDGEQGVWNLRGRPAFLLPTDQPGVIFVGMGKEVGTLTLETNEFRPLGRIPDPSPRTIINDGQVGPGGKTVVFGTKDTQFKDRIAALYQFALTDGAITVLADKQTCSNGKVFTRDARGPVLLDIDTPTRTVARYRFEVGSRAVQPDGVALDLHDQPGFPDGMCDGGDGSVIIAFYNPDAVPAGRAVRFDLATGKPTHEWVTPGSPRVTCPLLVKRPDGVKLILTTATEGMPATMRDLCHTAGNLFIADTTLSDCPKTEPVQLSG